MVFDPLYFIIVGPFFLIALLVAGLVKLRYATYSRVAVRSGITGGQFARRLLDSQGLRDVEIEPIEGHLTDHYDPTSRVVRLSADVYNSPSIAALGVAAHEVGHAIQHQHGYAPLMFRNQFYPVAAFGSQAWIYLFVLGMGIPFLLPLALICFGFYVVFALVTLPVEFNASRRALAALTNTGVMLPQEVDGARKVLTAAGLTYVASAAQAIATLLYILAVMNNRRD